MDFNMKVPQEVFHSAFPLSFFKTLFCMGHTLIDQTLIHLASISNSEYDWFICTIRLWRGSTRTIF